MHISENVSLSSYSTMRLGGNARFLAKATSEEDLKQLVAWANNGSFPFIMIGQGSNIVWRDEGFEGLVIVNSIPGREVISEDDQTVTIKAGGGEIWDELVRRTVENGWSGIEFMSLVPGTVGAAPVQNVGAYGGEISTSLISVRAFDIQANDFVEIPASECGFAYRTSRFKTTDKGRFLITSILLRLSKAQPAPPFYDSLNKYFQEHSITQFTPAIVRQAVVAIRQSKLPDPKQVANNGSFFTNPIVAQEQFAKLQQQYPDIQAWPMPDGRVKLAAGWLVEQAGFKGVHDQETGMATWQNQALVLVNEHAKSTSDLLRFRQKILNAVSTKFGVTLDQEPELLP